MKEVKLGFINPWFLSFPRVNLFYTLNLALIPCENSIAITDYLTTSNKLTANIEKLHNCNFTNKNMWKEIRNTKNTIFSDNCPWKNPEGKTSTADEKYIKLPQIKIYKISCLSLAELRQSPNSSCWYSSAAISTTITVPLANTARLVFYHYKHICSHYKCSQTLDGVFSKCPYDLLIY